LDRACSGEQGEVPRNIGLCGSEDLHNLGDVPWLDAEELEDLEANGFAEGFKKGSDVTELS
jgi:hypothetical protein